VPLLIWATVFYVALVFLAIRPGLKEGATLLAIPSVLVPLVLLAQRKPWGQGTPRHVAVLALVAVAAMIGAALWCASWQVDDGSTGQAAADWEAALPRDCPLMAGTLKALDFDLSPRGVPLTGRNPGSGPCAWPRWGVDLPRVTYAEFEAARQKEKPSRYIPHVSVGRPRYSMLHMRAAVAAGHFYGPLGAEGYICHYRQSPAGWRLQDCHRTWIS
jgi:hypothetical protein